MEITEQSFHAENGQLVQDFKDRFKFFADHHDQVSKGLMIKAIKQILHDEAGIDDLCCIAGSGRCYMEAGE
jgi:hypothetical protein